MDEINKIYLELYYGKSQDEIEEDFVRAEKYYDYEDPAGYPGSED